MNTSSHPSFLCPNCKAGEFKNDALNEKLLCNNCGFLYEVKKTIPRLVPMDNYSESFGYQWNIFQKTQLDSYTGIPISKQRLCKVADWIDKDLTGTNILEAGSGAGRFTEVLVKTKANLYSFDYSLAVDANFRNNGTNSNLKLFQGDIFNIPFKPEGFDIVICLGVIQHTPDPKRAFFSLVEQVKPGGKIYIDVYTRSWHHWLQWKYLLRPLTMRMKKEQLFKILQVVVPLFLPLTILLKKYLGKIGSRIMPIVEYSELNLSKEHNLEWAILDTFDMYSPAHDHPQSLASVKSWISEAKLINENVFYGDNGVVASALKPLR